MDPAAIPQIARDVLAAVGGKDNVVSNAVCMTRLRLSLNDLEAVDYAQLLKLPSVLGVAPHGENGMEVVFGPAVIDALFTEFSALTGLAHELRPYRVAAGGSKTESAAATQDSRPKRTSTPEESERPSGLEPEEVSWLRSIVGLDDDAAATPSTVSKPAETQSKKAEPEPRIWAPPASKADKVCKLLVINGPNLNMLGIREPGIYGSESYESLVHLCKKAGKSSGFVHTSCYQSNHEGDLVDAIQRAYGNYDAIVINPGAYTHTSVALLDALKAVSIPAVEVHISEVSEREEFRQVSYVRAACIATITGEGLQGYIHAIKLLAEKIGL